MDSESTIKEIGSFRKEIVQSLKDYRQNILDGGVNCIPITFNRFRTDFPGIRKKFYYLVSGGTKSSKTQITNYLFIINTIYYYINNPTKARPKIHYFPLEETKEDIMLRLYAYILFKISNGKIIKSPEDLSSVNETNPLPQEVLDLMETEEFINIANVFEECIEFHYDVRHPTGIYNRVKHYLDTNGSFEFEEKTVTYKDELGNLKTETIKKKAKYIPNDPLEYTIFIVDHVGLLSQEKGLTLKDTIEKMSDYCKDLRDKYHAIPVILQQQNTETTNLEAYKANKIRPTKDGLKDSKRTGEDCTVMIGITNPYSFGVPQYLGYNVEKLKDSFRILEIVLARKGKANGICPLYFNGAINQYEELPKPDDKIALDKIYKYIDNINDKSIDITNINITNNTTNKSFMIYTKIKNILKNKIK